ncbi:MAG: heme exporter protein CcmD [Rhodobacteraceae bacterium]|nr:heme exporter protein CcmD [Paracoccaceae bacterium]
MDPFGFGPYAAYIYGSYGASFAIFGGLILWTLHRNSRVRRELAAAEASARKPSAAE